MNTNEVVRAWKDEDYRDTLTAERAKELPQHPAGVIEFERPELDDETFFKGGKGTLKTNGNCCKTYQGHCHVTGLRP